MTKNKKKRVLFILHFPPPVHGAGVVGGYIRESKQIALQLERHFINLSTSTRVDEIGKGGFRKIFRFITILLQIINSMITFKPDLCYITISANGGAFYKDCLVVAIVKLFGITPVYHMHNKGVSNGSNNLLNQWLYKFVFRNSYVILLSKRLYDDIQQFVPDDRVRYCYNGIKHQGIGTLEEDKNNKTTDILFLSNLIESKGVNVLLDACRKMVDKGVDFHCTVVGGIGDITEADFHRYVEEKELNSNVSYLGRMFGNQKDEIFAHSDIFAFPTYYTKECFPLVLLEAMSFSLPVVSTFEGGIPDVVEHGVTGFLCPQKDAEALAEKLSLLISDEKMRIKMGKAGRERYEENFTLEIFEQRFASIIASIVGSE